MKTTVIDKFHVIGIAVRTTNENEQASTDIPALWNRFLTENAASRIQAKISEDIYCIYTDYEKDHTRPYTTLLGVRVQNLSDIPEGMVGKTIPAAQYTRFNPKGKLAEGLVYKEWVHIWNSCSLKRSFTADFEVYGKKAKDPDNAEVDIFIAIR